MADHEGFGQYGSFVEGKEVRWNGDAVVRPPSVTAFNGRRWLEEDPPPTKQSCAEKVQNSIHGRHVDRHASFGRMSTACCNRSQ